MRLRRTRVSDRAHRPSAPPSRKGRRGGGQAAVADPERAVRRGNTERRRRRAAGTGFARSPRDEEKRAAAAQRGALTGERAASPDPEGAEALADGRRAPVGRHASRAPEASLAEAERRGWRAPNRTPIGRQKARGATGPAPREEEGPRRRPAANCMSLAYGSPGVFREPVRPRTGRVNRRTPSTDGSVPVSQNSGKAPARRGSVHKR